MTAPSTPEDPAQMALTIRIRELEEAWHHDQLGSEALDELRELNKTARNGADKHLAFCLIERLEDRRHVTMAKSDASSINAKASETKGSLPI